MKKKLLLLIALVICAFTPFAQPIYNEDGIRLYHHLSQEEKEWAKNKGIEVRTTPTLPPVGELRPIAEYEPAQSVLIRYPFGIPMSLIKEMAKDIKVITIVSSPNQQSTVQNQYNSNGVNTANCEFIIHSTDSYWTRDYGPWFMAIDNSEVAIYDFNYNRPRPDDNQINAYLAPYLQMNIYASTLKHAGGNFMNDGTSQAASTQLVLEENPSYTQQQIEQHFLEYMGIEQYHFTADPLGEYIAHIDCWGKYLSPNKVMIGQVPTSNSQYQIYENVATYFSQQISPWGMPFQVYRVYTPGGYNATAYTNSLILNKKVFVPLSGNTNDAAAIQSYQNAMPGYEIIGITYNNWENTDALHCRTHEIADRCMLYIKHQPYYADMGNTGNVTFSTELYSYCNNTIYSDSVIVYISANGGAWTPYNMQNVSDNTWEVNVTGLPNGEIKYYIFAADESGRRECHPYIGAPDPHTFVLGNAPVLSLDKTASEVTIEEVGVVEDYITVSNIGSADLTFSIEEIDFDEMLTISPLEGTVKPGESTTLTFSYDYKATAKNLEFSGSCKLKSNDTNNAETEISLYALVTNVGINELNPTSIKIYPNPATAEVYIQYELNNPVKANIYNILGIQLKEITLHKGLNKIDINDLPSSIYFIKVEGNAYKIVKQ